MNVTEREAFRTAMIEAGYSQEQAERKASEIFPTEAQLKARKMRAAKRANAVTAKAPTAKTATKAAKVPAAKAAKAPAATFKTGISQSHQL